VVSYSAYLDLIADLPQSTVTRFFLVKLFITLDLVG